MSLLDVEGDFGLSMLQQSTDSFVTSPASALLALGLLFLGSGGNTKDQLRNAIGKGSSDNQITQFYSSLSKSLQISEPGIEVNVANRIYINGFNIKKPYLAAIRQKYDARAQNLVFGNADAAAKTVNGFVNRTTEGKIPELVKPSIFNDAVALLINAIYMKADWASKFQKSASEQGTFNVALKTTNEVTYMVKDTEEHYMYYEDDSVQVLTLPYRDPSFAFTIFLPRQTQDQFHIYQSIGFSYGLGAFKSTLTGAKIQVLLNSTFSTSVSVLLFLFSDINLKDVLISLGVTEVFSDNADLSGIADNLKVTSAAQKALIETDEEGSVAAAATVIVVGEAAFFSPYINADHPFLFTITYKNNVLFLGQFYG